MPFIIRMLVRGMQFFGRSQEDCAEYMFRGLTNDEHKGGFKLLNQFGSVGPTVTSLHEEAKEFVFSHISKILDEGKSIVEK